MDANEFIRKIRKLGRARGVRVNIRENEPKGGHVMLYYGDSRTQVARHGKGHEIPEGTLKAMLTQLGLTKRDIS